MDHPADIFLWYLVFIASTVVHEASHALASYKLGDPTAYHGGQVTLNPIPHIHRELIGTVIVPILSFFMGGWMIGWASTPYDPNWARTYPKRSAWMALAGPGANLVLILAAAGLIHAGMALGMFLPPETIRFSHVVASVQPGIGAALAKLISILFSLNLILLFFNLLPCPPLDGSGIIPLFLRDETAVRYLDFIATSPLRYLGLFLAWEFFDKIFGPIQLMSINLLYPGLGYH